MVTTDSLSQSKPLGIRYDVLLFSVVCLIALIRYYQPFPVDDAGFYFRYADHIANGFGYRWNIDEIAPIGASATLWPPLISLFQWLLGIPTQQAALLLAVMLLGGTYLLAFNVASAAECCAACAAQRTDSRGGGVVKTPDPTARPGKSPGSIPGHRIFFFLFSPLFFWFRQQGQTGRR